MTVIFAPPPSPGRPEPVGPVHAYYANKTASIVQKYGPGPRIHFHIGLIAAPLDGDRHGPDHYRRAMASAQEAMMSKAAEVWGAREHFTGHVLDAGCGLGGGAIFWAQEYGAQVTAITIVPDHLPCIRRFAGQAGVADRVVAVLADACAVTSPHRFDAVVAMESACYFPRDRWFAHLAGLLRPGGVVCVEDVILVEPAFKASFDAYWKTDIARGDEYLCAARAAGFVLEHNLDVTDETAAFWRYSVAWSQAMLDSAQIGTSDARHLESSIRWHEIFYQYWRLHGVEVRLLKFRLAG